MKLFIGIVLLSVIAGSNCLFELADYLPPMTPKQISCITQQLSAQFADINFDCMGVNDVGLTHYVFVISIMLHDCSYGHFATLKHA